MYIMCMCGQWATILTLIYTLWVAQWYPFALFVKQATPKRGTLMTQEAWPKAGDAVMAQLPLFGSALRPAR